MKKVLRGLKSLMGLVIGGWQNGAGILARILLFIISLSIIVLGCVAALILLVCSIIMESILNCAQKPRRPVL